MYSYRILDIYLKFNCRHILIKQRNRHHNAITRTGFIILTGALLGTLTFYRTQKTSTSKPIITNGSPTLTAISSRAISTGDGSYAIPTNNSRQMKFVSPKLGITFLYMKFSGGATLIKEEGDIIYIYIDHPHPGYDYHKDGFFAQVLSKNVKDPLEDTIRKNILAGVSQTDCLVQPGMSVAYIFPPNIEVATIKPAVQAQTPEEIWQKANKCHPPYAQRNEYDISLWIRITLTDMYFLSLVKIIFHQNHTM